MQTTTAFLRGDKVIRTTNRKIYIYVGPNPSNTPEYGAQYPAFAAFWNDRVYVRNINPKTGEAWQAPKPVLLSELAHVQ